jgi:DNA-binding PadR family transcriptional regulator
MRCTVHLAAVPEVTPQVLTRLMRDLERDGIVSRRYFPEVPPRVEYTLTASGTRCVRRSRRSARGREVRRRHRGRPRGLRRLELISSGRGPCLAGRRMSGVEAVEDP